MQRGKTQGVSLIGSRCELKQAWLFAQCPRKCVAVALLIPDEIGPHASAGKRQAQAQRGNPSVKRELPGAAASRLLTTSGGFANIESRRMSQPGARRRSWPRVRCAATRKRRNRRPTRTSRRAERRRHRSHPARRRPAKARTARSNRISIFLPGHSGLPRAGRPPRASATASILVCRRASGSTRRWTAEYAKRLIDMAGSRAGARDKVQHCPISAPIRSNSAALMTPASIHRAGDTRASAGKSRMTANRSEKIDSIEAIDEDPDLAAVSEVEARIREFVRNDVAYLRRPAPSTMGPEAPVDPNTDATVNNVNSLIQRVAGTSLGEIENLISELESLRGILHAEGQRVQREISGYAQLSQAAMKSTRMIADNVAQWKRAADDLRNS